MHSSNPRQQPVTGAVRGPGVVAEGRELYQSHRHGHQGHHAVTTLATTHRLRERIERARQANLNR